MVQIDPVFLEKSFKSCKCIFNHIVVRTGEGKGLVFNLHPHPLLAHLSWTLNFYWLFVVRLSVNFSHFHLLLQNQWANFCWSLHKALILDRREFSFVKIAMAFSQGEIIAKSGKIFWGHLEASFTSPISTNFGTY